MSEGAPRRHRAGIGSAMPWIVLGLAPLLATEPAWRIPLLGFDPTLDDLLDVRCLGAPR